MKKARDDISLTENLRGLQVFPTDILPKRSVGCPVYKGMQFRFRSFEGNRYESVCLIEKLAFIIHVCGQLMAKLSFITELCIMKHRSL